MLPKISGFGLSSESSFSIVCPHCEKVNEIKVARFVVAVARSESFVCVACESKFTVAILPQPSGNLTMRAMDLAYDSHCPECGTRLTWCAECEKHITPSH